jgi:hypothetical protein
VLAPRKWSDTEAKRPIRKFLEEVEVWFDATDIKGARRITTLSTLLDDTAREWFLVEKAKFPEGFNNAKTYEEVKEMMVARFVPKHQHFLDGIALVKVHQESGKDSLKRYAREFQTRMVPCPKMNEYAKLVNFYAGLEEATRKKYFERATVPENLDKALALADQLVGHSSSGGAQNWHNGNLKESHQDKKKQGYKEGPKRKREGDEVAKDKKGERKSKTPRHDNDTCYRCQGKGYMVRDCQNEAQPGKDKEKSKVKKVLASIQEVASANASVNEVPGSKKVGTFIKGGKATMKSLSLRDKVQEGGFEAKLNIMVHRQGLIYLKAKYKGTNISLLIDSGATNSFVSERCAKRLELELSPIAKPIKVAFAQGSTQATQVAKGVKFKSGARSFEEDFTMYSLGEVDFVLGNKFLHFYGVEIRQRPKIDLVMASDDGKLESLLFSRKPTLEGLGINLVEQIEDFEEVEFLLMLRTTDLPSNKVGEPKHGSHYSHLVPRVLEKYKDVITDELPKHLPPKRAVDHKIDLVPGAEPPSKAPYRLNQVEL